MAYLHGHKNMVPGVERALLGRAVGETLDVEVAPEDGYGHHDPALDMTLPLSVSTL